MTKRVEVDMDDLITNDVWLQGFNEGGAGHEARLPDVEDYMRGWHSGRECYDEYVREHFPSPFTKALLACAICAAAYLSILIFKHITQ